MQEDTATEIRSVPDPLDPAEWDTETVRRALRPAGPERDPRAAAGTGENGMVVGSSGPFATLAGEHALRAGGSAVDAALVTASAQIGWSLGSWVSYAGLFSLVHYEAATGEVTTLSAGFGTFAEETDPGGIPGAPEPSGRTALVPGFVAGAHAAHERFGRLPWDRLWSPARHLAEHGVPVAKSISRFFGLRAETLGRTAEARAAFAPRGRFPRAGEVFDPALLEAVRARGQEVTPHPVDDVTLPRGFWGGISRQPGRTPRYRAARTSYGQGPVRGV